MGHRLEIILSCMKTATLLICYAIHCERAASSMSSSSDFVPFFVAAGRVPHEPSSNGLCYETIYYVTLVSYYLFATRNKSRARKSQTEFLGDANLSDDFFHRKLLLATVNQCSSLEDNIACNWIDLDHSVRSVCRFTFTLHTDEHKWHCDTLRAHLFNGRHFPPVGRGSWGFGWQMFGVDSCGGWNVDTDFVMILYETIVQW